MQLSSSSNPQEIKLLRMLMVNENVSEDEIEESWFPLSTHSEMMLQITVPCPLSKFELWILVLGLAGGKGQPRSPTSLLSKT